MKQVLFLVLSTIAVALAADFQQGVRTTFGFGLGSGSKYYYPVPLYASEAESQGWKKTARPDGPMTSLELYCPPEYALCGLYDETGFIAGTQVAVQKDRFTNAKLDWKTQGYSSWTVDGVDYWAIAQYFVNDEFLQKSSEERQNSRKNDTTLQLDSIWLTSFNGELLEIAVDENKVDKVWGKQNCFPKMGLHYFYDLENKECASDKIHPWYILYHQGRLVATLWAQFGDYPEVDGERNWLERPPRAFIQTNFPDTPECFLKYTEQTIAIHQWFVDNPWDISCSGSDNLGTFWNLIKNIFG